MKCKNVWIPIFPTRGLLSNISVYRSFSACRTTTSITSLKFINYRPKIRSGVRLKILGSHKRNSSKIHIRSHTMKWQRKKVYKLGEPQVNEWIKNKVEEEFSMSKKDADNDVETK